MADFRSLPNQPNSPQTPFSSNPRDARKAQYEKVVRRLWRIFWGGFAFVGLSWIILAFFTPSFEQLEDPRFNVASDVYASDATTVLGRYFIQNRSPITFKDLSPNTVNALVSTEDLRYYQHSGIDPEALGRVLFKTVFMFSKGQGGGSTITQQLAKLLYTDRNLSKFFLFRYMGLYKRKMIEWITAVKLERSYTKDEIMAMYLNQADFINNAAGIRAAAEIYFGKKPADLNIVESATLVGMLQNPALYNPVRRPERCKTRRNTVLRRMKDNGKISETDYQKGITQNVDMSKFKVKNHSEGLAPYFRMEMLKDIQSILNKSETPRRPDGTPYDVYRDGLKVYTSIDPEMQRAAEEAMKEHMSSLQKRFFTVWKGKDPWTYKTSETTDEEIARRKQILIQNVRESDRYERMRDAMLGGALDKVENEMESFKISDNDIENMLKDEQDRKTIEKMGSTGALRPEKVVILRKIMESPSWRDLKNAWFKLQSEVNKAFNTKVNMKVFAYTTKGKDGKERNDKDTLMTPLDSIRYHRMHLQIGGVAIDPQTGYVRAWVGGINHKYFQYDHVRSSRQVGSTIKPFVYAMAIQKLGISPCMSVLDAPTTIPAGSFGLGQSWTPKNAGGYSNNHISLWDALKESKNTASVYLLKQFNSTEPLREFMNDVGIDKERKYPNGQYRVTKSPALCLGAVDLTAFEMAGAYATFANEGHYARPRFIVRITDRNGREIYAAERDVAAGDNKQVLSPDVNYAMVRMLTYVAKGAPGISKLKSEVGGKTGTTNDYVDGWYVGVTPRLVVATWVGGEDKWIRFTSIADGQGGVMARPFFAKLLDKIEANPKVEYDKTARFKAVEPDKMSITLDCSQYSGGGSGGSTAPIDNPNRGSGQPAFEEDFGDPTPAPTTPTQKPATPPATKPSGGGTPTPKPVTPSKPNNKRPDDGFEG